MRKLPPIAFLILHVAGFMYAVLTLLSCLRLRLLMKLLLDCQLSPILGDLSGPASSLVFWLLSLCVAMIALLAVWEGSKVVWRWRRGQPEQDIALRLRLSLYVAMGCLLINVFIISTPEEFSGRLRVRFAFLSEISATLAYGVYALWSARLPTMRHSMSSSKRRILDIVCMNVVVTLVLAEVSLRALAAFWPTPILVTESSPSQIRRDAEVSPPGTLRHNFPVNREGHYDVDVDFRPRKEDRPPLVVSIGDSFSYGTVPHAYHFTTVCEREHPGLEVYNMGYPGIGPKDYLYLLEEKAIPLEPDLVVVQLFLGNDVADDPSIAEKPRWFDADRYLTIVVGHRLQILRKHLAGEGKTEPTRQKRSDEKLTDLYPWLNDALLEKASFGEDVFLSVESRRAWDCCLPHEGMHERFFASLEKLLWSAGNTPLAFVIIPDEFQVENDLWDELVRQSDEQLDRDYTHRRVTEWLDVRELPYLDLLPALREIEPLEDGRQHVYHLRNTHFNARGNEVAGRQLASFVKSLLSAPRKTPELQTTESGRHVVQLTIGTFTTRKWMGEGWNQDELAGNVPYVWSQGSRSLLGIALPMGGDVQLEFDCQAFVFPDSPPQRVKIVINGTVIDDVLLRPGRQKYQVTVSRSHLSAGRNTVELRYAYSCRPIDVLPDSADTRSLAVCWYTMAFYVD